MKILSKAFNVRITGMALLIITLSGCALISDIKGAVMAEGT
ncbi:hypothetical protein [Stenoxybacter acetivorans]|nr:hypothetical protein [Stenoxybacter acetivorans]